MPEAYVVWIDFLWLAQLRLTNEEYHLKRSWTSWKMNHSIEFGKSSWAGANWTSSTGFGISTGTRRDLPATSLIASTGEPSCNDTMLQEFDKSKIILFYHFQLSIFAGPSVWVTTNQRTYKSEPVMARARFWNISQVAQPNLWCEPYVNTWYALSISQDSKWINVSWRYAEI